MICLVTVTSSSCSSNSDQQQLPHTKKILSYSLNGTPGVIVGNQIYVQMPFGTNITNLVASFKTTGINVAINGINQVSGVTPNSFINPVYYTVTAANNTTKKYRVNVTIAPNTAKAIISYSLNGTPGLIIGNQIYVQVPSGTNLSSLVASFITTGTEVTVNGIIQISDVTANSFLSTVNYTVTAANQTIQTYSVTVIVAPSSAKAITAYSLDGIPGLIIGNQIIVQVPEGTDVTDMVASFTTTGTKVAVNGISQTSGVTVNSFANPVNYTVTAANLSTITYSVTVIIAPSSAKAIINYSLNGVPGLIIGNQIYVQMPSGTNLSNLVASFTFAGVGIAINGVPQISAVTANSFVSPVTYTVTAADQTTQIYSVTVTIAPSSAKAITSYSLNGIPGLIIGNQIILQVPAGTNVNDMVASFTTTGTNITINGTAQISGVTINSFVDPVNYIVTAANLSTITYSVTVIIAPSSAKAITSYSLNGIPGLIIGTQIFVQMPYGTDVSNLTASFITTGVSITNNGIVQYSGISSNNFTTPLKYVVTAANQTTQIYSVTVIVATTADDQITSYSINGVNGSIIGNNITVTLPYGTDPSSLVASFVTNGNSITVGGVAQVSGVTYNNFTSPVVYTVNAVNNISANYTVTVTILPSPAKAITSFSIDGIAGQINGNNITVTMLSGTDVTKLTPVFQITGVSISVNGVQQFDGTSVQNFTTPKTYTVTAANGTTADYTVTVNPTLTWTTASSNGSITGQNPVTAISSDQSGNLYVGYQIGGIVARFTPFPTFGGSWQIVYSFFQDDNNIYTVAASDPTIGNIFAGVGAYIGSNMYQYNFNSGGSSIKLQSFGPFNYASASIFYNGTIYYGDAKSNIYADTSQIYSNQDYGDPITGFAGDNFGNLYFTLGASSSQNSVGALWICTNVASSSRNCYEIQNYPAVATSVSNDQHDSIYVYWQGGDVYQYSYLGVAKALLIPGYSPWDFPDVAVYDIYHAQLIATQPGNTLIVTDSNGNPRVPTLPSVPLLNNSSIANVVVDNTQGIIYVLDSNSNIYYIQY